MALNIKNAIVEKLAADVARLAHESKTEAIRVALTERASRLRLRGAKNSRRRNIEEALAAFRRDFPKGEFGRGVTKAEEEEILGYGPGGV